MVSDVTGAFYTAHKPADVFLSTTLSNRGVCSAKHSNMGFLFNSSFLMEKKSLTSFLYNTTSPKIYKAKLHAGKYPVLFLFFFWAPGDIDLHI